MLHTLSSNIAVFLLSKNCFEKENLNIYVYGTELVISSFVGAILIFCLSVMTDSLLTGLLFYIVFNTLRSYTGGLHCQTYLKCNITFVCVFLICLSAESLANRFALSIMIVVTFVLIIGLAPVENPNKPIEEKDKLKFRLISLLIYFLHIIAYFVLKHLLKIDADIIIITDFISSILMIIGIIKNRRCNYEND